MKRRKTWQGLLAVAVVCAAAWAYYAVVQPRRAVGRFLAQVSELQVGRTSQSDFERIAGNNPPRTSGMHCKENKCTYAFERRNNRLLELLRIAPAVYFYGNAETNGKVVTSILLYVEVRGANASAHLRVEQFSARVTRRSPVSERTGHVSARTLMLQDGTPVQSLITLDEDASNADRHNAFGIDAGCWSRLSGCSNVRELLPNFAKL